jgi:16S rRNA (cytosine967-C5)-methyltransferase
VSPAGGPRGEALRVLVRVEQGAWSDRILASAEPRLDSARDRRFLHQLVLTTLRWQLALDAALAPHVRPGLARIRPHARAAMRLASAEARVLDRPAAIAVDAALDALRAVDGPSAVGLVNAVLRRALAAAPGRPAARESLPGWLRDRWWERFGEAGAERLAEALNRPGRPFLVARRDRGGREAIARDLAEEGVRTELSRRHPDGLAVVEGAPQTTACFARGDVVPVNEASALVARLARPEDGGLAADLAAAPGGKSACLCQDAERLVALDRHGGRTRLLARQLSWRSPAGRAWAVRADAAVPVVVPGRASAVLVDAPCSGTGTLRRRPEIRTRLRPEAVARCAAEQERILEAAAALPGPEGALTYAVCSLEPEEGAEQVARLLARHPELRPVDPVELLGPECAELVEGDPPLLRSRPEDGEHDGFVAARVVRR